MTLQVKIDGVDLLPEPLFFDGDPMTVSKTAFKSGDHVYPEGTQIELVVADAPEVAYYETPTLGLTMCLIGEFLP